MAYTPKTWQCGETIMADDLNHMEQGIAQGSSVAPLVVNVLQMTAEEITEAGLTGVTVGNAYRFDTTDTVVKDAFDSGRLVCVELNGATGLLVGIRSMQPGYGFAVVSGVTNGALRAVQFESNGTYAYPILAVGGEYPDPM